VLKKTELLSLKMLKNTNFYVLTFIVIISIAVLKINRLMFVTTVINLTLAATLNILILTLLLLKITNEQIASINDIVAPLMIHKHHSVNHVFISHPDLLSFSKSTFLFFKSFSYPNFLSLYLINII
ncbi:MAG: hypothetical protein ACLTAK_06400, partial [Bacilli bacterium]